MPNVGAVRGLTRRIQDNVRTQRIVLDNNGDLSPIYPPVHIAGCTTAPSNAAEGDIYYNSSNNTLEVYTGAAWETLGSLDTSGSQTFAGAVTITGAASLLSTLAVTGRSTLTGNTIATTAGTGITTGTGTIYASSAIKSGGIYTTSILIDITGLAASTTLNDIIGVSAAANCHLGQITAAVSGTILGGVITCLETPAGGDADIDLYSATESTGTENALVTGLTETVIYARAASWAVSDVKAITTPPAANEYLYLAVGAGAAPGTYTAGKFLIDLYGYV